MEFIGEVRIPWRQTFSGTTIGGISGIDYDATNNEWIMISDDRSEHHPARYYRARLGFDQTQFKSVELVSVTTILQPDGRPYPNKRDYLASGGVIVDLESIRIDPRDSSIWYASEGDVQLGLPPFVRHASATGHHLGEIILPRHFHIDPAGRRGPRNNASIEGISFAPDGNSLWISLEEPLLQDGPVSTVSVGGITRITQLTRDGLTLGQFAYPLDPLPMRAGKGRHADSGVSEILALTHHQLLVMERAGIQDEAGEFHVFVKIYEVDTSTATDIQHLDTLQGAQFRTLPKRLVADLNAMGLPRVDNLEGMSLGPPLRNGHPSFILISDDNFSRDQITQLLLFELITIPPTGTLP